VGQRTFSFGQGYNLGWLSPAYPVKARRSYRLLLDDSAANGVPDGLAVVEVAWYDRDGALLRIDSFEAGSGAVQAEAVSPSNAADVRLVPKLLGPGRATFFKARLVEAATGEVVAAPSSGAWEFAEWFGAGEGRRVDDGGLAIIVPEPEMPFGRTGVAYEDWVVFSFEAMAAWMNECAAYFKDRDPSRLVLSYVGFVFGQQALWDCAAIEQRLDISLHNAPNLDVAGFQLCIAGDDFTWAASNVDMARKYAKPMWCTDLIDFPYGHVSGFIPIYRGSMACAQHGLDGFLWYGWTGYPDYSFYRHLPRPELERLCNDARSAVEALDGFELVTNVAQLMPIQTYSLADRGGYKGDALDNGGLYHLLLDCGLLPEVFTPYELEHGHELSPDAYPLLFVSDCPVLKPEVNRALLDYVRAGGRIIGTGRSPQWDFAWAPLRETLSTLPEAGLAGQVDWRPEKAGRAYWGEVRRHREHGNTPPVFVETDDPERTPMARRRARMDLLARIEALGAAPLVEVDLFEGVIHAAAHRDPRTGERIVFLLHTGPGRHTGAAVRLNLPGLPESCVAWTDFDKEIPVEFGPDGALTTPPFTHVCLLRLPAP
jgi:hypothetical protein